MITLSHVAFFIFSSDHKSKPTRATINYSYCGPRSPTLISSCLLSDIETSIYQKYSYCTMKTLSFGFMIMLRVPLSIHGRVSLTAKTLTALNGVYTFSLTLSLSVLMPKQTTAGSRSRSDRDLESSHAHPGAQSRSDRDRKSNHVYSRAQSLSDRDRQSNHVKHAIL